MCKEVEMLAGFISNKSIVTFGYNAEHGFLRILETDLLKQTIFAEAVKCGCCEASWNLMRTLQETKNQSTSAKCNCTVAQKKCKNVETGEAVKSMSVIFH